MQRIATEVDRERNGFFDEGQPLIHGHIAELPANQTDLMVRAFAKTVLGSLLESHGWVVL